MLNAIVLGEALINDAVAVLLCHAIEEYDRLLLFHGEKLDLKFLTVAILKFFYVFLASFGFGALIGCSNALLTKFTRLRDYPILETSIFLLMSFSSYLLAEACSITGIVAVLFCGVFQAHYTYENLSNESKLRTKQLFEILSLKAFLFA